MQLKLGADGKYTIKDFTGLSQIYFPLFNLYGMKSAITPSLHGDAKTDQHHYAMIPVSGIDLHQPLNARNVFFLIDDKLWNISGQTPWQKQTPDKVEVEYGFLYQKVRRTKPKFTVEITSFVPVEAVAAECHRIVLTNTSQSSLRVKPATGIVIYGRSADNIRDHRHVTSLLNRGHIVENGIINQPTMSFDERGHRPNKHCYGVFAYTSLHQKPSGYIPEYDSFVGEAGDLFYPEKALNNAIYHCLPGDIVAGKELIGGLVFEEVTLAPAETLEVYFSIIIADDMATMTQFADSMKDQTSFTKALSDCIAFWQKRLETKTFTLGNDAFTGWLRHVGLQPLMRRIFGNSYLPHHDYGRGGRGWRDLWQDSLEPVYSDASSLRSDLLAYLGGVRIDGSNATIIGSAPGEFFADRNKIVRVWSDHGAWPLQTISRYLEWTGDLEFLLVEAPYFKDRLTAYTHQEDREYHDDQGTKQLDASGNVCLGTVIEHLLVQNLVPFFNVGDHGNIRIEDADWNDGFDMAKAEGETVAFTHFYAGNYDLLKRYLEALIRKGVTHIRIHEEIAMLFDNASESPGYPGPEWLRSKLAHYFESIRHTVTGKKIEISLKDIICDLQRKRHHLVNHLLVNEWLTSKDGEYAFFNGYYDGSGNRVENPDDPVRMTLTGQTFALMAHTVAIDKARQIHASVRNYLADAESGSLRLNTDFGEVDTNLGRFTGFAYGHKENGALFSHMAVMYVYGLLDNGLIDEGCNIIDMMYKYLVSISTSRVLPGIPEYIDSSGRGMYPFLTGSASWLYLLIVEQVFGVRGRLGDLSLSPKIPLRWFVGDGAGLCVNFAGNLIDIRFLNPDKLDSGSYRIGRVMVDSSVVVAHSESIVIPREKLINAKRLVVELESII